MKNTDWMKICAEMQARWPHSPISDATMAAWWTDVEDLDAELVLDTVRAIGRDGAEFPPTGGMIRKRVVELVHDEPDAMEAWRLVISAVKRYSHLDPSGGITALEEQSPALAEAARRFGWRELCTFDLANEGTFRAQFRDTYKAVVAEGQRDSAYTGLSVGPRKPQRELRKPDFLASVGAGEDAA